MTKLQDLTTAVPVTDEWIDAFMQRIGWHDRERAYLALLAALHAVRDCLGRDEAVHVGAHLPALLRGLYYDGWHPEGHAATKSRNAFMQRIHDSVHRDPGIDPEDVARAVLGLIAARLPAAEVEDARAATPKELHNLWPS